MDKLDEYESVFRSSDKAQFEYEGVTLAKAVLITDGTTDETKALHEKVRHFFRDVHKVNDLAWTLWSASDYDDLRDMLSKLDELKPDLVVTLRCLTEADKNPPYSLGVYLDVLTQVTDYPILVLPDPQSADFEKAMDHLREAVVVTDHLTGDSKIINWAARFVPRDGKLVLTHVEDDAIYDRYMEVISKIPEVPTEDSRELIREQLLKEPAEFIDTVRKSYAENSVPIELIPEVRTGHVIGDYQQILDTHEGDLLVMHTKDESQMAMKGHAYAILVEYRHVALLLL